MCTEDQCDLSILLFNSVFTFYSNFIEGIGKNWLLHRGRRPNTTKFYYLQCDFFPSENKNVFKNVDSLNFC